MTTVVSRCSRPQAARSIAARRRQPRAARPATAFFAYPGEARRRPAPSSRGDRARRRGGALGERRASPGATTGALPNVARAGPARRSRAASRTRSTAGRPKRCGSSASPAPTARPPAPVDRAGCFACGGAKTGVIGTLGSGFPGALCRAAEHHARRARAAARCSRDFAARRRAGRGDGSVLARPRPGPRERRRVSTARCSPT